MSHGDELIKLLAPLATQPRSRAGVHYGLLASDDGEDDTMPEPE